MILKPIRHTLCGILCTNLAARTIIAVTLLGAALLSPAFGDTTDALRGAAMQMMGASVLVPSLAAYCNKVVAPNDALLEAAAKWNSRNRLLMEQTVRAIRLNGDASQEEKALLDRLAIHFAKEMVEAEPDKLTYCFSLVNAVNSGAVDLDRREDLAEARRLIFSVP